MSIVPSFLAGQWQTGRGPGTPLVNPATEEVLAHASSEGLDLGAAVAHGRERGGPALRALSFPERGALLSALSKAIHAQRDALIGLALANAGSTRGDAKFDIDGATATLAAYGAWGAALPPRSWLLDGAAEALGRTPRFLGQHLRVSRRGLAVHVNAFNFPAWGMAEKLACAILAGVPVLEKPGTPTALVAEAVARLVVESAILPEGSFQFLAGGARDLLDHLGPQDGVAFTGSSATARVVRRHPAFVERGARLNVEADSLNAAVLGPDVSEPDEVFALFLREVVREMTQKAGQKCTAIRRVLVPAARVEAVCVALAAELALIKVGDPAAKETRMGPLTNGEQLAAVQAGIARLLPHARVVCGGGARLQPVGAYLAPTLLAARDGRAGPFHDEEVFGPVASVLPYDGSVAQAGALVAAGQGSLVASIFSDDRSFTSGLALELLPWTGRVYAGDSKSADQATGHGLVLPSCVHGGPGRAGGGEELGGLRGLDFYTQRGALQGGRALVEGFGGGT